MNRTAVGLGVVLSLALAGYRPAAAREFFVSADGLPAGDGSKRQPLDLATALSEKSPARPGDTVWLLGGVYKGTFTSHLTGKPGAPIIVRQFSGARATLDGKGFPANTLTVKGAYAWYWGFEVMNSDPTRVYRKKVNVNDPTSPDRVRGVGINGLGPHTKFINLTVHDTLGGFGLWQSAIDAEVCGCLTYNNGVIDPARGHGHGLYIQNRAGTKFIRDVISFNNHATGMKGYSEEGFVQGLHFEGVSSFNNGWATLEGDRLDKMSNLFVGSSDHPADRITVVNNYLYHAPRVLATNLQLGYQNPDNGTLVVKQNHIIGGSVTLNVKNWKGATIMGNTVLAQTSRNRASDQSLAQASPPPAVKASAYSWEENTYFDGTEQKYPFNFPGAKNQYGGANLTFDDWRKATGFDRKGRYTTERPTKVDVFVRRNRYEPGRANITIYNWDQRPAVNVDLSASGLKAGQSYQIMDAQNFYGAPVASGVYGGHEVQLPMKGLVHARPIGEVKFAPVHTAPAFGVFVLLSEARPGRK